MVGAGVVWATVVVKEDENPELLIDASLVNVTSIIFVLPVIAVGKLNSLTVPLNLPNIGAQTVGPS